MIYVHDMIKLQCQLTIPHSVLKLTRKHDRKSGRLKSDVLSWKSYGKPGLQENHKAPKCRGMVNMNDGPSS